MDMTFRYAATKTYYAGLCCSGYILGAVAVIERAHLQAKNIRIAQGDIYRTVCPYLNRGQTKGRREESCIKKFNRHLFQG